MSTPSLELDSKILNNLEEIKFIEDFMKQNDDFYKNKNLRLKLIYRMTRDGKELNDFKKLSDGVVDNLLLIKSHRGYRFGGFCSSPWNMGTFVRESKSFCFSIDKKRIYKAINGAKTHVCGNFPRFYGVDTYECDMLTIYKSQNGIISGVCGPKNNESFEGQEEDYEMNGGYRGFDLLEWELFKLIFI